jgi:myo-inositol 2-dehydrogenase/D-chiro-inositol 1-dehydrogenase
MTVRVALIGAGIMGADHGRILADEVPGARVQVVVDAAVERARAVAEACGAADAGTDALGAIGRVDVDAVLVASPDDTHAALTLAAIAAGKPVLCEKPLAPAGADCLRIVEAEVAAGRRLVQVGFMRRFDPGYVEMKRTRAAGGVGAALMLHNLHRNVAAGPGFESWMAIVGSAPHEFDAGRFLLGTDYAAVTVFRPGGAGVGAPLFVVLETAGGPLVTIEVNVNAAYGYDVRGELVGAAGTVALNPAAATRLNAGLTVSEGYAEDWRPRFAEAYRRQDLAWVRAVETGVPAAAADAWDGYCATLVAEAGVRALKEGRRVEIGRVEAPGLYREG